MPRSGHFTSFLTEEYMRYVMKNTESNRDAAKFAGVGYDTWARYAKEMIDVETGKSFFQIQREKWDNRELLTPEYQRKAVQRYAERQKKKAQGEYIPPKKVLLGPLLKGHHPEYTRKQLLEALRRHPEVLPKKCGRCGFDESNPRGFIPLRLDHINSNYRDHRIENLRWLCYNCYGLIKSVNPAKTLRWARMNNGKFAKKLEDSLKAEAAVIAYSKMKIRKEKPDGTVYWVTAPDIQKPEFALWTDEEIAEAIRNEAMGIVGETKERRLTVLRKLNDLLAEELGRLDGVSGEHEKIAEIQQSIDGDG